MKKIINGKEFEEVAGKYVHSISAKHTLLVYRISPDEWEGRETMQRGKGKFANGEKTFETVNTVKGNTLQATAAALLEMVEPSAKVKASIKYNARNTKQIKMNLNIKTDDDILAKLASVPNIQGYIKELIRKDI